MFTSDFMTHDEIRAKAPAVFTETPAAHMSNRYHQFTTAYALEKLAQHDFFPVSVSQDRPRSRSASHVRHAVVLRHASMQKVVGQTVPQILLVNSHNGRTKLSLRAGLYRFVCANGMVIGNDNFHMKMIHNIDIYEMIDRYAEAMLGRFGSLQELQERWDQIELSNGKVLEFARKARELRFGSAMAERYSLDSVLDARREEDDGRTLWTIFNRAQENLTKGGLVGVGATGRRTKTRQITDIGNDIAFNERLWNLGEEIAEAA